MRNYMRVGRFVLFSLLSSLAFFSSAFALDMKAKEDFRPLAAYPRDAFVNCIEGTVDVRFMVSEERHPINVEILYSSHPDLFNPAVLNIIYHWKINEHPVGAQIEDTFLFDIGEDRCP